MSRSTSQKHKHRAFESNEMATMKTLEHAFNSTWSTLTSSEDGEPIMSSVDAIDQIELFAALGDGPIRFGPFCREQTLRESMKSCGVGRIEKYVKVKMACEKSGLDECYTDEEIFRVVVFKEFSAKKSIRLLKRMDHRYTHATARQLEEQLRTQTLFPLPQLKSETIDDFFYMRPSRHRPGITPTSTIIANLVYVMSCLYERHRDYRYKIGFIANMKDWTMIENFGHDYCLQFMLTLQGHTAAVNVDLFLIVNPPSWFDRVWKIMRPMLSPGFRKKVHMIPEEKLGDFLKPGFGKYLPDEFKCGSASSANLVEDFITYRKHVEESSRDGISDVILDRAAVSWPTQRKGRRFSMGGAGDSQGHLVADPSSIPQDQSIDEASEDYFVSRDPVIQDVRHQEQKYTVSANEPDDAPDTSWSRMKDPWDDSTEGSDLSCGW